MTEGTDLSDFMATAGQSLAEAQGGLTEGSDAPSAIAIAEAELEIKATVESGASGKVALQPISSREMREAEISPGLLSTLRVRYVAVAEEIPVGDPPKRTAEKVIGEVRKREDVAALDRILDGLEFDAVFVPETRRWLVTATDPRQRLVREVLVPDVRR